MSSLTFTAISSEGCGLGSPVKSPGCSPPRRLFPHNSPPNQSQSATPCGSLVAPCERREWHVVASRKAKRTTNPIRSIVDNLKPPTHHPPSKPLIPLSLGDPTVFGNLRCPDVLVQKVVENVTSAKYNGYAPSVGDAKAREALAVAHTYPDNALTDEDVLITSGCSGALEIVITALINAGDALLIPRPGFSSYQQLTESLGGVVQPYDLHPEHGWEIDLEHLEAQIDERTRAILINNPSNPCGNVLPLSNLRGLLEVAERHCLPVISDEIYGALTFTGHPFHPLASLTTSVPILAVGGLAKEFVVPGWRVGWILIYDQIGAFESGDVGLRQGLKNLTQMIHGANTLAQSVIPALFAPPDSEAGVGGSGESSPEAAALRVFREEYRATLEGNAAYVVGRVRDIPGLRAVEPQGAMYVMIGVDMARFPGIADDVDFAAKLLHEENIVVLPGQCFGIRDYVRVVFAPPRDVLAQAFDRIQSFCERHAAPAVHPSPR